MRVPLLAIAALLPLSASGAVILSNTPDTTNQNVTGCYGANSGNPAVGPCFTSTNLAANNHSAWIGIGWTMGANAYPLLEADVMLFSLGFAPCNGCSNQFGGYLFRTMGVFQAVWSLV